MHPYSVSPSFSKNTWIHRSTNGKYRVNYHPRSSGLTSGVHLVCFYNPNRATSFQKFCLIFSKSCISHYVWKMCWNLLCSDYWKMHFWVKMLKVEIFTHAPPAKLLSYQHLHITTRIDRNHSPPPPPGSIFFWKSVSPAERGGGYDNKITVFIL